MRGRFLLFAAMLLLAIVSPAQAVTVADDPCVSLGALVEDHDVKAVLVFAAQCTVLVHVGVAHTSDRTTVTIIEQAGDINITTVIERVQQSGNLMVTIAVAIADEAHTYAVECTDIKFGDTLVRNGDCERYRTWMN